MISARTTSRYYNGDPADDHIPEDIGDTERDEIGIIRAICIKVQDFFISLCPVLIGWLQARSSSQRKEAFKDIQRTLDFTPVNLLLDMKVRWSSTYVMLYR